MDPFAKLEVQRKPRPTVVVNIRKHPYDVYIGRAGQGCDGYFGNPYHLGVDGNRAQVIAAYRAYFEGRIRRDPEFKRRVLELRGKRLGCFCKPDYACHGDVIAEWLNKEENNVDPKE